MDSRNRLETPLENQLNISGIVHDSVVDGPGIRMTVFTQGCVHNCLGCHNEETRNFDGGKLENISHILDQYFENPLYDGITISGGEPFCQTEAVESLISNIKGKGANVIVYTGFTWEQLISDKKAMDVLKYTDYLVDGQFVQSMRSLDLKFKGSSNQRTINVQKSLESGNIMIEEF